MQAHRIALIDEHFNEAQRAVWLSKKRGATPYGDPRGPERGPYRDAADARSSRTKAR